MRNRTIVITGASRGLGQMLAEHYASANTVIGVGRTVAPAGSIGGTTMTADLSDPDATQRLAEDICERWPDIDVLINNAAVLTSTPITMMKPSDLLAMVNTNLVAPMILTRRVIRSMMRRRRGWVVNILSMSHKLCKPGDSVYAATKGGLEIFAKTVNAESHRMGITVNNVAVSALDTGMLAQIAKASPDRIKALIPHGDFAPLESIIASIDFLCAEGAHDVGGQTIYLGGV
jgi:3-oxoacyl-[acyl-carrier protein] reductase